MFTIKSLIPKTTDITAEMRARILNALKRSGKYLQKQFERTIATWENTSPKMETKVHYKGGEAILEGELDDSFDSRVWKWLDEGTSVRYATMSKGFIPKTIPKVLDSGNGQGGVWFVSKKYPHPGIKAREWTPIIEDTTADRLADELDKEFDRATQIFR